MKNVYKLRKTILFSSFSEKYFMLKKPCGKCPFGPNAKHVWGEDIEEHRESVIRAYIAEGAVKEGEPQICHVYLIEHVDEYKEYEDVELCTPTSEKDVCVGHQQYLNSLRDTQSGKATRLSDVTGSTPVL